MISKLFVDRIIFKENDLEDSYLSNVAAVKALMDMKELRLSKRVTFFTGENGTGKSTIIEAIAIAYGFNPEGGTKNFNFSTKSSHSKLFENIRLSKSQYAKDGFFLRAESFFNVASNIDYLNEIFPLIDCYGGVSLHEQSHGESFLALVQNRFCGNGLYILDEPESALSPMRLLNLIAEIDRLASNNSQFIIATHSPILMSLPNSEIFEISDDGIISVNYKNTQHYQVTRSFLENPDKFFHYILEK